MTIPESQLQSWTNQGAVATSADTYNSIRIALDKYSWPSDVRFETYLQGSYKNGTNIRGDSDVDVVVQLNSAFRSNLTEDQKKSLEFISATYGWSEFREDVSKALSNYFGWDKVENGKKSLKVRTSYLPADVIVCFQYRKYRTVSLQDFIEGMTLYIPNEMRWVINYPKLHYDNGVSKNAQYATNGWYKRTVRLFKNARTYLEDQNAISASLAPSYFLECLLYNFPNSKFGTSFQDTFYNALNWLTNTEFSQFKCQNEQVMLWKFSRTMVNSKRQAVCRKPCEALE